MQRRRITSSRKRTREVDIAPAPQRNVLRRIVASEISGGRRGAGSFARESFSHFTLKQEFDGHINEGAPASQRLELLDTRSRIVEIVGAKNYVFCMTKSGACMVYDTGTSVQLPCLLSHFLQ